LITWRAFAVSWSASVRLGKQNRIIEIFAEGVSQLLLRAIIVGLARTAVLSNQEQASRRRQRL
jgi:uncharacterized ion transporter superfamily protein YfcC